MELQGKIVAAADHRQAVQVPAVERNKGVKLQEKLPTRRLRYEYIQEYVGDACDGCHDKEHRARGEEGLGLPGFPPFKVHDENDDHGDEEGQGDGKLGHGQLQEDEQEKDDHAQVDRPEAVLPEEAHQSAAVFFHHAEHDRHGDEGHREGEAEKENVQCELGG